MFKISKPVFYWGLYDFANSLIISNLTLYFAQWLIVENQAPDIWYGSAIAVSTILLLVFAPILASFSDRNNKKIAYIRPLSIVVALSTLFIGLLGKNDFVNSNIILINLILFIAIQFAYQLSLVFYDTFLAQISKPKDYGKVSGFGEAMGSLGHVAGLILSYPFVKSGSSNAFIPAAIGFIILSLPMLLTFKDKNNTQSDDYGGFKNLTGNFRELLKDKNILFFLIAFYFISDVVLTIQTFFPVYFSEVLYFNNFQKILASVLTLAFIVLGGIALGSVSDRFGYKKVMTKTSLVLLIIFCIFPTLDNNIFIWILFALAGFFWGGFNSASRALLTKITPEDKRTEFFSLFTIFRRSASIIGPMVWSLCVLLLNDYGTNKYRLSVYPLMVFIIGGQYFLRKVKHSN